MLDSFKRAISMSDRLHPAKTSMEHELQRRGRILEAVAFAAERFLASPSFADGLEAMLERLGRAAEVDRVVVYQNHRAGDGRLRISWIAEWAAPGNDPLIGSPRVTDVPYDPDFLRWQTLLSAGRAIHGHVRDLPEPETQFLLREGIRSIAVVPIFAGEDWWGGMGFGQCTDERVWSAAELGALRAAAGILGATIQQGRAEAALRETEDRYRWLVELSPDAIALHRGGVITYANRAAARLLRAHSPDALAGRSILEFVHHDSRPFVLSRLQRLREGRTVPLSEEKFVRLDGTTVDVEVAATPFVIDGEAAVQIMVRDISDRRKAEEAVRQSEARKSSILDSALDAVITMDHEGRIQEFNPAAEEMFGRPRATVLGQPMVDLLIPPSLRDRHLRGLAAYLSTGQSTLLGRRVEMIGMRADGSEFPIELAITRVDVPGPGLFTGYIRDVTKRRQAEEALRESEERYRRLVERSPDAIVVHSEGKFVFANDAAARLLGANRPDDLIGRPILDVVHPDYWAIVKERVRREVEEEREVPLVEEKFVRLDGSIIDVEVAGIPFTYGGKPAGQVVVRDITDRKRAESALRQRSEYLAALHETALGLMKRLELRDLLQAIVTRAAALLDTVNGAVYLAHQDDGELELHVGTGVFASWIGDRVKRGEGMLGRIWDSTRSWTVEDYSTWPRRIRNPRYEALHAGLAAPLTSGGQFLGILGVAHTEPGRTFDEDAQTLLEQFARLASIALDNAQLYAEAQGQLLERERAEAALRQRSEFLATLHQVSLALMEHMDPHETLETIVAKAGALAGTEHGFVYLVQPEGNEIEVKVSIGAFTGWNGHRMAYGEGLAGKVWATGEAMVIDDYDTWEGRSPSFPRGVFHAVVGLPLRSGSQVVGIIGLAHVEGGKCFTEEQIDLLSRFGSLASIALDNARLHSEAQEQLRERERVEQQLREAEAKYRTLVERIPAITYTAEFGETAPWLYVSPQIEAILGFTPDEWMVRPNLWSRQLHPDDRERVIADERHSHETGAPMLCEYRLFAKDGRVVWVRDESVVIWAVDGEPLLQGVMLDVTERKQAEEQLREAETRYRTLVEQIPAISYIDRFDDSARFTQSVYFSPQVEAILGYRPEELQVGGEDTWASIIHPEDRDRVLAAESEHYRSGEPLEMEYRLLAKDGRVVWVLDEGVVVPDSEGNPRSSHGILYDITERKRVEEDLERALRIERQATERLRALDELKNTFLHAVSHELRTPLAAVLGFALTLEREEVQLPPAERKDIVRRLAANARKLDQLLSDLLDLDRLDRGIVEPRRKPTDVAALVRRVVENSDVLGTRPVRVEAQLVVAPVDGPKVERIVENLLVNAARHTPPDSTIWVKASPEEGGVLIAVEDDGSGVPEALREKIFEPFRQGPHAPAHSPGVGIGLSLVARFAELHGGRAWVEDRPGGGASFRVFLPGSPYFSTGAPTSDPYSVHEPS